MNLVPYISETKCNMGRFSVTAPAAKRRGAGGGTLLTTISTSGLGAGVVFLGNNLSQAANSLTTTSSAVTPSVQ